MTWAKGQPVPLLRIAVMLRQLFSNFHSPDL